MNPIARKSDGKFVGVVTATAGTAALACGVCCVLPIAIPAIALGGTGAVLAWFGRAQGWITWMAAAMVAVGWLWIGWQSIRSKAKTAPATFWWMSAATLALVAAFMWPYLEPIVVSALTG